MKANHAIIAGGTLLLSTAVLAAGGDMGQAVRQPTNWTAIGMFVLFVMYLGILAINRAVDEPTRAARVSAVLIIVGFVNIPIIKFSVEWWNTLHQPASVLRFDGPALDIEFLRPLLIMGLAFTTLFATLYVASIRNEIWRRKLISHYRLAARAASQRDS